MSLATRIRICDPPFVPKLIAISTGMTQHRQVRAPEGSALPANGTHERDALADGRTEHAQ